MGMGHEQRRGVRADGHEGPMAERDLAIQARQQTEAGQSDDVQSDLTDLEVVVGTERRRDGVQDGCAKKCQEEVSCQGLGRQPERPTHGPSAPSNDLGPAGSLTPAGPEVGKISPRGGP